MTTPTDNRPDVDIEEEIAQLVRSFPPLKASRPYFTFNISEGHVAIVGNVRNPQARRVLVDNVSRIHGVVSLDASRFFDDEMIRVAAGHMLPPGVYASVQYGAVALTGRLPEGADAQMIIDAVSGVPGVRRVGAEFGQMGERGAATTPATNAKDSQG